MKNKILLITIILLPLACAPLSVPVFTPTIPSAVTPSFTSSPILTQTPVIIIATISIDPSYLYAGPSLHHKMILCGESNCSFPSGTQVVILEKYEQNGEIWYLISTLNGETGWLLGSWLIIDGDLGNIPTASYIPTYPQMPSKIPASTYPPVFTISTQPPP